MFALICWDLAWFCLDLLEICLYLVGFASILCNFAYCEGFRKCAYISIKNWLKKHLRSMDFTNLFSVKHIERTLMKIIEKLMKNQWKNMKNHEKTWKTMKVIGNRWSRDGWFAHNQPYRPSNQAAWYCVHLNKWFNAANRSIESPASGRQIRMS